MDDIWQSAMSAFRATEEYLQEASHAMEQEVSYLMSNSFPFTNNNDDNNNNNSHNSNDTNDGDDGGNNNNNDDVEDGKEEGKGDDDNDEDEIINGGGIINDGIESSEITPERSYEGANDDDTVEGMLSASFATFASLTASLTLSSSASSNQPEEATVTIDTIPPTTSSSSHHHLHVENNDDNGLGSDRITEEKVDGVVYAGQSMKPFVMTPEWQGEFPQNTYSPCAASTFNMRVGPNYDWNKLKAPSPPQLMEIVGIDCFHTPSRVDNVGSRVNFPSHWLDRKPRDSKIPPLFIVNFQVPSSFATSFFREINDGDGWSLVLYFRFTQETIDGLNDLAAASPAVKLLADYISKGPEREVESNSEYRGRFKITVRCDNIEEFGLPSFITAYNAKPVLIRHTGTLLRGTDYVEMDINVHKFGSVPKKALEILIGRFPLMKIAMGFCVESRADAEMPETLFGCVNLTKPANHWPAADPDLLAKR